MSAEGGVELPSPPSSWDEVGAAGLDTTTVEPLRAWRLQFAGDDAAFDLELEATGALAELDPGHDVARAGGMAGYEQPVRVTRQRHRRRRADRGRRPRPARALLGRARLGSHRARAHGLGVARRRPGGVADRDPAGRQARPRRRGGGRLDPRARRGRRAARARRSPIRACRRPTTARAPAPRGPRAVGRRGRLAAPRGRRDRVRDVAGPRAPAPGLRLLPLADGGPRGLRALRRAAPGVRRRGRPAVPAQLSEPSRSQR